MLSFLISWVDIYSVTLTHNAVFRFKYRLRPAKPIYTTEYYSLFMTCVGLSTLAITFFLNHGSFVTLSSDELWMWKATCSKLWTTVCGQKLELEKDNIGKGIPRGTERCEFQLK